ncbi:hypothetical protein AMAG_19256 [Allomyces macrogynus ATCC 38327]|uniref:Uncharacterized protein n=1 Tax=Allomyces macrogynus (strain ATCC 38327) TaxID=578462 RepID=A0A0L0SQ22_ALLM3|nr:hypothetical protein AMAG_19256 [Allomyces macrogynus ATCC 38327]|eukprot:KNE64616.1 hypothetical protein AMAG_19256 [Allomyces macrogynus ATCC 38327]
MAAPVITIDSDDEVTVSLPASWKTAAPSRPLEASARQRIVVQLDDDDDDDIIPSAPALAQAPTRRARRVAAVSDTVTEPTPQSPARRDAPRRSRRPPDPPPAPVPAVAPRLTPPTSAPVPAPTPAVDNDDWDDFDLTTSMPPPGHVSIKSSSPARATRSRSSSLPATPATPRILRPSKRPARPSRPSRKRPNPGGWFGG